MCVICPLFLLPMRQSDPMSPLAHSPASGAIFWLNWTTWDHSITLWWSGCQPRKRWRGNGWEMSTPLGEFTENFRRWVYVWASGTLSALNFLSIKTVMNCGAKRGEELKREKSRCFEDFTYFWIFEIIRDGNPKAGVNNFPPFSQ